MHLCGEREKFLSLLAFLWKWRFFEALLQTEGRVSEGMHKIPSETLENLLNFFFFFRQTIFWSSSSDKPVLKTYDLAKFSRRQKGFCISSKNWRPFLFFRPNSYWSSSIALRPSKKLLPLFEFLETKEILDPLFKE